MSIEFNRRTFLKTSAALAGAAALVSLTGCDSSSSSKSPAINKEVDIIKDSFRFGSTLKLEVMSNYISGTDDAGPNLILYNLTDSNITLYSDSFSAFYKGNALRLVKVDEVSSSTDYVIVAKGGQPQSVMPRFAIPSGTSITNVIDDVVFKFHYNDKSIKFQTRNKGNDLYTSGVYTDKIKV